jgi:hypothetical protein
VSAPEPTVLTVTAEFTDAGEVLVLDATGAVCVYPTPADALAAIREADAKTAGADGWVVTRIVWDNCPEGFDPRAL